MATDKTVPKQLEPYAWQPGVSPNPAGRPKGARNKLGEDFIQALHESFQEHGAETIETVRTEKPDQYLKVIASLCPKELNLNVHNDAEELSDDELRRRVSALANRLAEFVGGTSGAGDGTSAQAGKAIAPQVH